MAAKADHPEYVCIDDDKPVEKDTIVAMYENDTPVVETGKSDPMYENETVAEEFKVNLTPNNETAAVTRRTTNQKGETSAKRTSRYDEELYALPDVSEDSSPPDTPPPASRTNNDKISGSKTKKDRKKSWISRYANTCIPIACFFVLGFVLGGTVGYFTISRELMTCNCLEAKNKTSKTTNNASSN